ncbi:MAG: 1-acyl-sn-glycerol-3-phosphate acyltransferase [Clostridia bacterium]|nr:1-acyl-sn-glycerol-3-phosphate acyltransferase [Clostridia bacterium]
MGNIAKKKWLKPRHRVVRNLVYMILYPYSKWRYGLVVDKFKAQEKRPYLILLNHQTPFDQFFVGMSISGPVYYMASEDLFSNGWVSSLIRWLIAPIPIRKQTTDVTAVKTCLRVAKEGGTIAIAPEGNRTYSGKTEYMNPAIAPLAKKLGLPILLYRIEGGYGAEPRWSDCIRKGKVHAFVSRVLQPSDYAALTDYELYDIIKSELYVNEGVADGIFRSNKRAEYLERAVYVCPFCGLSRFESHGNAVTCLSCNRAIEYGEDKRLSGKGFDFPFRFMTEWYDYQADFINKTDVTQFTQTPLFTDTANVTEVILQKKKIPLLENAVLRLYGDRMTVLEDTDAPLVFPFDETSAVTVLGRNKLNVYFNGHVYQFKGGKRFNALKYVHIYHRYKNISKGDADGSFLGL